MSQEARTTFFVVAGLCLVGLAIRTGYEMLRQAGRVDTMSKPVFGVVFAAMVTMLLSWPAMCRLDPWPVAVPGAARWVGLALVAVALLLAVGGLVQLRGLEGIDHLVTTGLYARVRHPMYAGFILWIVGWVLHSGAGATLALAPIGVANILYWRWLEERALESRYGDTYRHYRQATWA
jgi:protein-S-isoprenylcysteine O-methyltransferase Ste14